MERRFPHSVCGDGVRGRTTVDVHGIGSRPIFQHEPGDHVRQILSAFFRAWICNGAHIVHRDALLQHDTGLDSVLHVGVNGTVGSVAQL